MYVPDIAVVADPFTCGFCEVLAKPFGPVQLQFTDILLVVLAVKFNGLPVHTGVFDEAVGFAGVESTKAVTVPANDVQLFIVADTR